MTAPLISLSNYRVKVDNGEKSKVLTIIVPSGATIALQPVLNELEGFIKDFNEYIIKISSEAPSSSLSFPPGVRDPNPYRVHSGSEMIGKPIKGAINSRCLD